MVMMMCDNNAMMDSSLEDDDDNSITCCKPTDIIRLNVSGTKLDVLRRTLTSVPGSVLAAMFSSRWNSSSRRIDQDEEGRFFINFPVTLFGPLIEYLQTKESTPPQYPCPPPSFGEDKARLQWFRNMLEYYELTQAVYPWKVGYHSGFRDAVSIIAYNDDDNDNDDPSVVLEMTDNVIVTICADGHDRQVASFQVLITPQEFEIVRVGWISNERFHPDPLHNQRQPGQFGPFHRRGVGNYNFTIGMSFDSNKDVAELVRDGRSLLQLSEFTIQAGSVLRCEYLVDDRRAEWYADNQLVSCHDYESTPCTDTPAISGVGTFKVTRIKYLP